MRIILALDVKNASIKLICIFVHFVLIKFTEEKKSIVNLKSLILHNYEDNILFYCRKNPIAKLLVTCTCSILKIFRL